MTEEEKKIAEDEIAAGPEGNRPTQSTTSVANQGSGTSEVPFPVDKSQNYPSTESTGSIPRQKFSKEFLEENPDLKVAFAQSEMQRRGVTPTTGATGGATPTTQQQNTVTTPASTEGQQVSTPVANQGEQLATPTTGQEQQQTSTPTTNGAENPDNYTFTESELQAMEQQQTPQGGVVSDGVSSTHLYNYSDPGTSIDKILADPGNENSTNAILNDYFRWCQETGTPIDYFTVNAAIHNKDISKSPADNAKEEKRQQMKEKWDKVGNFLLHLGNVVGNVAGGGMGSVKLEDPVQWSERQRMLKERTEQLQNSYNQSILAQMTKQNADMRNAEMAKAKEQRDQQKLENDKRRLDQSDARIFLATEQFKWKQQMDQKNFDLKKAREEVWKAVQEGRLNNESARIVLGQLNYDLKKWQAENPVQSTTTVQTPLGTKTTKKVQSRGNGNQVNSNLIPPSKQKQNQGNNNTPPSRR